MFFSIFLTCVSFHFLVFLYLRFFPFSFPCFFEGCLHSGRQSNAEDGRSRHQGFRVPKVNLATLKGSNDTEHAKKRKAPLTCRFQLFAEDCARPAPSSLLLSASVRAAVGLLFKSAHCPGHRNQTLVRCHFQRPERLGLLVFLEISYI